MNCIVLRYIRSVKKRICQGSSGVNDMVAKQMIYDWCDSCGRKGESAEYCKTCLRMTLDGVGNVSKPNGFED